MSTVTLDQMSSKLLSMEQITQKLQETEPLSTAFLSSDSKARFHLAADWAHGIDALPGTSPVGATMTIAGKESPITKEGMFQAAANFGLTAPYIKKVPAHLIEGLLNYHYNGGMGSTEYNVLSVAGNVSAFTRPTLATFSNLQLLERAVEGIQARRGSDTPIFADYKFNNSLTRTDVRLVIPGVEHVMQGTEMQDVPGGEVDAWLYGIHLSNSVIGKTQTSLEAYMFRWWCTNGATTKLDRVGTWSRRANGQQDDVYAWAEEQIESILGGLEHRFEEVQALARLDIRGNMNEVVREIFDTHEMPVSQRQAVTEILETTTSPANLYTVMNAITSTANDPDIDSSRADRLMRIGGEIPTEVYDTLKARIYREGQANPEGPNPYAIQVIPA